MTNEKTYKVLWVDDDASIIDGFQLKAEDYNISLCHVGNWQEAELLLKSNFEEFSAIILDAECKINAEDPEESSFIHKVLPALTSICGKKQCRIPWYILSAGTMEGFDTTMHIAQYTHEIYDKEWGNMLYSKTCPSNSDNSPEKLFENIQKIASHKISNIVLYRYQDTFQYMGEGKLINKEARNIMLKMLCELYRPEDNPRFEYQGNPLRKVLEYVFRAANRIGLLPSDCFDNRGQLNLLDANRFMSGLNTIHSNMLRYGKEGKGKDGQGGDTIFPHYMGNITKNILNFTNSESHTNETNEYTINDKDLNIDENTKELFFSYVLQLCHVIKYFGHFAETHNDEASNIRMTTKVYH